MTYYELWNTKTGNAVGDFESEAEALAAVREAIRRHGREYVAMLALGCGDEQGNCRAIAQGEALADRALHTGSRQSIPA